MKRHYSFAHRVNFTDIDFAATTGDTGIYDESNLALSVYRDNDLVRVIPSSHARIHSLEVAGWLVPQEVVAAVPVPPAALAPVVVAKAEAEAKVEVIKNTPPEKKPEPKAEKKVATPDAKKKGK